jgi:hypothetical protein
LPGDPGANGLNGATGPQGPAGLAFDGQDGDSAFGISTDQIRQVLGTAALRNMGFGAADLVDVATLVATFAAISHTHAAADIVSGLIATARLGSGTANSSTFLRGDQTWAAPPAGDFLRSFSANTTVASDYSRVLVGPVRIQSAVAMLLSTDSTLRVA